MSVFSTIEIALHLHGKGVTPVLVATRRPVEGSPGDWVACTSYYIGDVRRWAVVQRVGPIVSSTLDLDAEEAVQLSIDIARRSPRAPLHPGGPHA